MSNFVDKKHTKQVRIDTGLHQLLKLEATRRSMSIKTLIEGALAERLAVDKKGKKYVI